MKINQSSPSAAAVKSKRHWGRFRIWLFVILLSLFSTLVGGAYWLGTTTSGLQWLLTTVSQTSGNTLAFADIHGNLRSLRIGLLTYQDEKSMVKVKNLAVDWQPRSLLNTTLQIDTLTTDLVELHSAPSEEPLNLPDTLQLPINVVIDRLGIRTLHTYILGSETPDFSAREIALRLNGNDTLHRLPVFTLTLEQGKLAGKLKIATHSPFALSGQLIFHAWPAAIAADYPASSIVALRLRGNLEQPRAALVIQAGELQGQGNIALHPFATQPLASLNLILNGINPQRFSADFPMANLNLAVNLQQTAQNSLQGNLNLQNTQPRPIDQSGVPLRQTHMRISLADETIVLDEIAILLGQAKDMKANLSGNVTWHMDSAAGFANIDVHRLNPALLDTRMQSASLSGNIALQADQDGQQAKLQLHDKALQLKLETALSRQNHTVTVEKLDFSHGNASVSGHGNLQLDADQPFSFEGILKQFDLSALIDAPPSDLNASFKLNGQLAPQPAGKIDYTIERSHYARQPVTGKGVLDLNSEKQLVSDAELRLGDNLLQAKGRLGKTGDRLLLTLTAPKLAQSGLPLQGDLNARITLDGRLDNPDLMFEANSTRLNYGGEHELAQLKAKGSWQRKTEAITLDLQTGYYRMGTQTYLQKLMLTLTGTENRHQLSLTSTLAQARQVQFQANGSLVKRSGNSTATEWHGNIQQFALTGSLPVKLITQPEIIVSAEKFLLGHTRFMIASGQLDVQQANWTPKNWATQGKFDRITLTAATAGTETTEPLTIAGSWQLAAGRQFNGNIRLQRTSGDLVLPLETPFALGLQTLALDLLAEGDAVNGKLHIEGKHIGKTQANIRLPLQRTNHTWQIHPSAPLSGNFQFDLPDLAWIGPAIDDSFLSSGKLAGNATFSGTLDAPLLQGIIQGQALSLALLDEGLQLQDGKLALRFDQENVLLDALSFSAPLEKPSKDRLLRGLKLARQSGEINLDGRFNLRNQTGELRLVSDHLPLAQQPDRWIVVSGNNRLDFQDRTLTVRGATKTEVGFLKQPKAGRPTLDDDVIIISEKKASPKSPALTMDVDASIDLGEHFYLRASGLEGRLAGQLQLRGQPGQPLKAIGSIATRDTRFEAYGQKLQVKRGIVNFDGPLDNPGLNILAVRNHLPLGSTAAEQFQFIDQPSRSNDPNALAARNGLPVEAGVEITGTVRTPKIKLVSQPNVPDSEKLSWLILGRAPNAGGLDNGLLLGAASSILGGQSDASLLDKITQGLGFDDFSIRQREGSSSLTDQIGSAGKRLSSRAYLSYERGLTNASLGIAKLTYTLFPNITLVTRAGEDSAVDVFYNFSFD